MRSARSIHLPRRALGRIAGGLGVTRVGVHGRFIGRHEQRMGRLVVEHAVEARKPFHIGQIGAEKRFDARIVHGRTHAAQTVFHNALPFSVYQACDPAGGMKKPRTAHGRARRTTRI